VSGFSRPAIGFLTLIPALSIAPAAELTPETIRAWNKYVQTVDARMKARADSTRPFLWIDEVPARCQRVRDGEVVVASLDGNVAHGVPHGLIHAWIGAVFIPHVTVNDVLAVVQGYDRYKDIYKPAVVDAKLLERNREEDKYSMLWLQKVLFITSALDGEFKWSYFPLSPTRSYSVSTSTRLQEIRDYGQPGEQRFPPDKGSGFLWRLCSITRYEERDGGVFLELEAYALSRGIPASLHFLVAPVVARLSRDSIAASLRDTRGAAGNAAEIANRHDSPSRRGASGYRSQ
jgi:hypothetical protein